MEAGGEGQGAFKADIIDESMLIPLVRDLGGCLPTLTLSAVVWRGLGSLPRLESLCGYSFELQESFAGAQVRSLQAKTPFFSFRMQI